MSSGFHLLSVREVREETPDAVTVVFHIPEELKDTFAYRQGQYLTLKVSINGEEHRRAYSMCSSPLEDEWAVTVKRVEGGTVSTFIHKHLGPGITLEAMPPQGRFHTSLDPEQQKDYYLFGAGSGITPLMSIMRTILEREPLSTVYLLYGNRNEKTIIFRDKLDEMLRRYEGQLVVEHILSRPERRKAAGIAGWIKKGEMTWEGRTGRIDAAQVKRFLREHPSRAESAEYFVCGPGDMIDSVKQALLAQGVEEERVHVEHFVNPGAAPRAAANGSQDSQMVAHLDGERIELRVTKGQSLLDALIDNGYDPPYSCTAGVCSTCMAKVLSGSASMEACYALDDEEVRQGLILTCQAHPTTPAIEITYDV